MTNPGKHFPDAFGRLLSIPAVDASTKYRYILPLRPVVVSGLDLKGRYSEKNRNPMASEKKEGIVVRAHGQRFIVNVDGENYDCRLRGRVKFKTSGTTPVAVGDDVVISIAGRQNGAIEEVKKRRSVLSRPAVGREDMEHVLAANIDVLMIVVSVSEPPLRPGLIDRFLIAAQMGNLTPAIVLNKVDLGPIADFDDIIETYQDLGYDFFVTSAVDETGLEDLRAFLKKHRSIMAGHSGVGKSSLLNKLLPGIKLKTAEISKASGKGKHTTSHIELFELPSGGWVIDTPGIKVLGLWLLEREKLDLYYPEMLRYRQECRFTGCSHISEPDCAVKTAVEEGNITDLRYNNYCQIYESL